MVHAHIRTGYIIADGRGYATQEANKDEDVLVRIETWLDEINDLTALGQPDLPPSWKVTAIKMICTDDMRKDFDKTEIMMTGQAPEKVWAAVRDQAMDWSRAKKDDRIKPSKSNSQGSPHSPMDIGNMGGQMDMGPRGIPQDWTVGIHSTR